MKRIPLGKLNLIYEIGREGNMTRAANNLHLTQSALSKALQALEDQMETKLFERVSTGMRLTPQGERLYAFAEKILQQANGFGRVFYEKEDEVEGEFKIITTPFVGTHWLVPNLKGFLDNHSQINIKILLRTENFDPSEGDALICTLIPHQPHLIQKPLFSVKVRLFASPAYLKKFGTPQKPEDLDHHRLITYKGNYYSAYGSTNWVLNVGIKAGQASRTSYFEIDSLQGMLISAECGYGIAELPALFVTPDSGLVEIMSDVVGPTVDLYYIFHKNRKRSKKIEKFFQYLLKKGKLEHEPSS